MPKPRQGVLERPLGGCEMVEPHAEGGLIVFATVVGSGEHECFERRRAGIDAGTIGADECVKEGIGAGGLELVELTRCQPPAGSAGQPRNLFSRSHVVTVGRECCETVKRVSS